VNQRWLGGMLTNFATVYKRLQRLKELEEIDFGDVASSGMTKKELLQLRREHDKLDRTLGGIRDMSRVPSAIWVVDTKKEHIAVNEARKLGIPVVAILDTNCDPDEVNYPIPGNDDAIRSVALLTRVVADAVAEGLIARAGAASVLTNDIDALSLVAARLNARANDLALDVSMDDWLAGPEGTPDADIVIAGDVCYERDMSTRALAWLRGHARLGRLVLLGDPGRNYFSAQGLEERARYEIPTSLQLENRGMRETVVWRVLPYP